MFLMIKVLNDLHILNNKYDGKMPHNTFFEICKNDLKKYISSREKVLYS